MENKEIFVPLKSWLIGGSRIGGSYNIYTGSIGTDPMKGAIGQKIFNYRVWIEKNEEETEFIKVAVYYGMACFENQNEDDVTVKLFELNGESTEEIRAWIKEMAESFFAE